MVARPKETRARTLRENTTQLRSAYMRNEVEIVEINFPYKLTCHKYNRLRVNPKTGVTVLYQDQEQSVIPN